MGKLMGWKPKQEQHFRRITREITSFRQKDKEIIVGN